LAITGKVLKYLFCSFSDFKEENENKFKNLKTCPTVIHALAFGYNSKPVKKSGTDLTEKFT